MMDPSQNPFPIHLVSTSESPEFVFLTQTLTRSSLVALDAEWKPTRSHQSSFPVVSLLQLACRLERDDRVLSADSLVFLIDLTSIHLPLVYDLLKIVFVSADILKLGFRFKQDFAFLSSTFRSHGCEPGFDRVEPFLDVTKIYSYLQLEQVGRKMKEIKSLAAICKEVLGISLSKEHQCSDWSYRPLSEEQKVYAATDAYCLLEIFKVFQVKVANTGDNIQSISKLHSPNVDHGLKKILEEPDFCCGTARMKANDALEIFQATASVIPTNIIAAGENISKSSWRRNRPMDVSLQEIVRRYGENIILMESDRNPKASKRKGKKQISASSVCKEKHSEDLDDWRGPPPWDLHSGGNGCPRFLCDVMVEGLAKHLRCVGIDAAIPYAKKPEPRELIDQAYREKRVLLTRDTKLLRHQYLLKNQIYRVKCLLKNEQLLEVIENFKLKICEDQLMSRCTKCNGEFIQKPLTTEEAVEAANGFQVIPKCLFDKNFEFWRCMDCSQLYWEGTQYQNAVQKFTTICKLNE